MESTAFPNKTIKMKLMKLKDDEYHFMSPKITQKRSKLYMWNIKHQTTPFFILIATQRENHQSKKAQRKNLVQAVY